MDWTPGFTSPNIEDRRTSMLHRILQGLGYEGPTDTSSEAARRQRMEQDIGAGRNWSPYSRLESPDLDLPPAVWAGGRSPEVAAPERATGQAGLDAIMRGAGYRPTSEEYERELPRLPAGESVADLPAKTVAEPPAEATTTTTTSRRGRKAHESSLQPLAGGDDSALRHLAKYHSSVGGYDVESPFPLDVQQQESLREGAIRPSRVPEAEAVRTVSQALIGGRTRTKGWGGSLALAPLAEGLAQYLEWHAGARDRPSVGRMAFESATPLAFSTPDIGEGHIPRPEGEATEGEQHETFKRAKRAFEDLINAEKEQKGISTEPVWEDVLGEHHRSEPIDVTPPKDVKPVDEDMTDEDFEQWWNDPEEEKVRLPPKGHKPEDYTEAEWEPLPDEEHIPDDYWEDYAKHDEEEQAEPDTGPIAKDPLGENYVPLPDLRTEEDYRWGKRRVPFLKHGSAERSGYIGALAAARGAPAGTQPGVNPQFLRRVDAELEARAKGDYAFSIFQPFTTGELEQMRDVEIK